MSNDVETLSKLLEKSSMALLRTVIPSFEARSEITSLYAMRVLQGRCDYKAAAESIAKSKGITDRKKIDELADILKGTPEDEQRAAEISDEYRNAKKKIEAMSATDRAALFETSLNELKPLLIDMANVYGQQRDKFIAQGVKDAPGTIDAAVTVCRDAINTTALSIATMGFTYIALSLGLLPPEAMHNAETMRKAKEIAASFLDVETTAQYILDAMPETMGYLRQHAPAIAGTLETHARRKIQESTSPLWECFDSVIEAAEKTDLQRFDEEQKRKSLPFFKISKPKNRYSTLDNITAKLFYGDNALVSKAPVPVKAGIYGGKKVPRKRIDNFVSVIINESTMKGVTVIDGETGHPAKLKPFDREVFSAVCSIVAESEQAGKGPGAIMTAATIYQALTGKNDAKSMSVDMKANILATVEKLERHFIQIDAEDESKYFNSNVKPRYRGRLLPAEYVDFMTRGNVIVDTGIHVFRNSALFYCAEDKGQVTAYPVEMLNAPISNTKATITLKGYLANRIKSKGQKPIVKMDTLFDYLMIDPEDNTPTVKKTRQRIRKAAISYFSYCKEKGFIKGYELLEKDTAINAKKLKGHTIDAIKFVRA